MKRILLTVLPVLSIVTSFAQHATGADTMALQINEQNTIYVKSVFNGTDTLNLNFDTGATELILTTETINNKLRKKPELYHTFYTFRIGNTDFETKVYDAQLSGHGTDGLFGWNFFKDNIVELNYDEHIMVIHTQLPAAILADDAYSRLNITYINGLPCIVSSIGHNGASASDIFIFDTGYQRTAMLDNELLEAAGFPAEQMKEIKRVIMKGAQGN